MSFIPRIERTLKVRQIHIPRPTVISEFAVGSIFKLDLTTPDRIGAGNLTGVSLSTHTATNDTVVLPSGRYFIQAAVPVAEPAHADNSLDDQAYIEWQNFSSSSLNGTYSAFGNKGRSNPGDKLDDAGDNAGVHAFSTGIIESNNTIYLQIRVVSNYLYTTNMPTSVWSMDDKLIIWRAD